jgi:hypothetical protein
MAERDPLSTEELTCRAQGLLQLGNSPARIRATLSKLNATPEQVDEAMASIEVAHVRRTRSDSTYLWILGGVTVLFFITIFLAGYWRLVANAPVATPTSKAIAPGGSVPRPQATSTISIQSAVKTLAPNIPIEMLPSMLPSNIPANFMLATPVIVKEPTRGTIEGCPKNTLDAAHLFGGDPDNWTLDRQTNGWTMTVVGPGVTIHVPEGMQAGYLLLANGPEMRSVSGPATLKDINFIALSCP